ncbi:MAG: non-ribosomal peptide synthetase [Pikeienuella sp.]
MNDRIAMLRARVAALPPEKLAAFRAKVEASGVDWARVAPADEMAGAPARPARPPLSPGQTHFWLLQQIHPESAAFTIAFAWDMDGPLDRAALERSLAHLVARHEPLRTGFPSRDGQPWQEIAAEAAFALEEAPAGEPDAIERDFAARPFDLARPPLFRAMLLAPAPGRWRLLFAFHHIIADGWSRGVFMRELAESYRAFRAGETPALPALKRQFADLALEQIAWLDSPAARAEEDFWREELAGLAPQALPAKGASGDRRAATILHEIDPALAARVAPAAAALGATPFMLLLAVFQLLSHRMTGANDIAVGAPAAGRGAPDSAGLIGLFVNTLVLRARPRAGMSFRDWLAHARAGFARAFEHQDLPFARVVEAVGAARRAGETPLFQTLFQVQSAGYALQNADIVDLGDPGLSVRQRAIPLADAKFDLSWHMMERPGALSVIVEYRAALFDEDWIRRMLGWFETLLAAALGRPDAPIETLDFAPAASAHALKGPEAEIPHLVSMLGALAGRGETALICDATGARMSGADLDAAATRLARRLRARPELSGPDPRLAIALPRGPGLAIALLAALKAGVAYVPLDPAHPAARRDMILRDAGAGLMLAEGRVEAPCPTLDPATLGPEAPEAEPPAPDHGRIAYLIFTSGSTGRPKGVPITHGALSNLIASMAARPGFGPEDRMLALTTIAFDIAGLELLLPLAMGGKLVIADGALSGEPDRLAAALEAHAITHMQATPATWRLLVGNGWAGRAGLTALCGGEALPADLGRALLGRVGALWNMYGPTETTIWSAARRLSATDLTGAQAPVGDPVANTALLVLDRYGAALPPGLPGELAIGGAGLSPGYAGRPDLTAERFVSTDGGRLYLTGDRVRLEPDGALSFLGRLDHQIKLNGHRIEPGEIEAALIAAGAQEALALADGDRLIAYCRAAPEPAALRAELAQRLPGYMIPAVFVMLDAFPLNANGKIDRAKLPKPEAGPSGGRAAETPAEKTLQGIWAAVLGRADIGAEDNFFDLGGASVSAMQIAARAREAGLVLTPAEMFEHQTIAAQAAAARPAARPAARAEALPLSPWQRAHLAAPGRPWRLRLPVGPGLEGRLGEATAALAAAHPALRFALTPEGWRDGGDPLWRAEIANGALEIEAHPLLLDAPSVARLGAEALALLRGDAAPAARDDHLRWLGAVMDDAATTEDGAAALAPLAGDGPGGDETPVTQVLSPAALRAMEAGARALNTAPARIAAAALARTLAGWGGGPVSFALIEDAPGPALGCFTRVVPLRLGAVPTGAAESLRAVEAAAGGDPRGIDPRAIPAGAVILSWRPAPAAGDWIERPEPAPPSAPALHVEAEAAPDGMRLIWRFDAARLRRETAARLAARHLAELAAPPSVGAGKLDQLRARLQGAKG